LSCKQYCSDFRVACQADPDANIFASQQECEAACALFPSEPSYDGTSSSSSWQCRATQASYAANSTDYAGPDFGTSCTNAGTFGGWTPFGDQGLCGINDHCDGWCALALGACTGSNQLFPDLSGCRDVCITGGAAWSNSGTGTENSITCRLIHVQSATLSTSECAAASVLGGNVCGAYCDNYCAAFTNVGCAGSTCMSDCAGYSKTGALIGFNSGNNLQCFDVNLVTSYIHGNTNGCNRATVCPPLVSSSSAPFSSSSIRPSSSSAATSSPTGGGSSSAGGGGGDMSGAGHVALSMLAATFIVAVSMSL